VHWFNLRLIQRCGGYAYAPNQWAIDTAQKSYENRKEDRKFRPVFGNDDFYRDAIEENFPNLYSGIFEIPMMMNIVEQLPPVNPKKVMWVGRCVKEKDALRAMEAMVELSKRGYECHYFTENVTQEKVSLFGAINKAREKSEVFFHLNKNAREIDSHYADSNVLLWPTRDETVGLVGIEGAIHGCRVVFTLDLCKNTLPSEYAFHREWKTSAEMADAVEEVMNEPFDREGCARYFRERYSREECIARLNELFEREPNPDYGRNAVFMTETLRELIEEYRAKNPVH
jgi:glycosyltransferase involved in cell wall biosynthesis